MLILDTQVSNNEAKMSLNASFHTVFLLLELCDVTEGDLNQIYCWNILLMRGNQSEEHKLISVREKIIV